jgi:hypothetical protein
MEVTPLIHILYFATPLFSFQIFLWGCHTYNQWTSFVA